MVEAIIVRRRTSPLGLHPTHPRGARRRASCTHACMAPRPEAAWTRPMSSSSVDGVRLSDRVLPTFYWQHCPGLDGKQALSVRTILIKETPPIAPRPPSELLLHSHERRLAAIIKEALANRPRRTGLIRPSSPAARLDKSPWVSLRSVIGPAPPRACAGLSSNHIPSHTSSLYCLSELYGTYAYSSQHCNCKNGQVTFHTANDDTCTKE